MNKFDRLITKKDLKGGSAGVQPEGKKKRSKACSFNGTGTEITAQV